MSRYTGPRSRIIRRLGYLPGLTGKEPQSWNLPGQHGGVKGRESQYAVRLREKQKLRYNYGLTERQLVNYVREAKKNKRETGNKLISFLEMRLDNVVFRLGIAPTVPSARQVVSHRKIFVNGEIVSYPSYQVRPRDTIGIKVGFKLPGYYSGEFIQSRAELPFPAPHLCLAEKQKSPSQYITVGEIVKEADMESLLFDLDVRLVIEYYARRI